MVINFQGIRIAVSPAANEHGFVAYRYQPQNPHNPTPNRTAEKDPPPVG
jgi:hypothetical protein